MTACAHLHVHSYYSLLDGLVSPAALAAEARAAGFSALALTDRLCLAGAVEFQQACTAAGIQPIFGLEVDLAPPQPLTGLPGGAQPGPLTLLAAEEEGWANLCRLTALLLDDAAHAAALSVSLDVLRGYTQGVVCLSGGRRSLAYSLLARGLTDAAQALLRRLATLFPGRFYLELNAQSPAEQQALPFLLKTAERLSLPTVAAQDIFYLRPDQAQLHHTVTAIRRGIPRARLDERDFSGAHFAAPEEMATAFRLCPPALQSSLEIARRCVFQLPLGRRLFPALVLPAGQTAADVLRTKAATGAKKRYSILTPVIQQRLDHEIGVICEMGFEPIFLIMEEIIAYARSAGVPVSSRGSAASSLVAYCLNITTPEPLELNLYFERFLNPARLTPPDIDTDLCSRRRDLVIQHVFEQYGRDRVAMVGTINRYRPRSALGEVAKAYGFSAAEARQITGQLPFFWYHGEDQESGSGSMPFGDLPQRYPSPRHQQVFHDAQALLGLPRHLSVHAGGIVITPGPLTDLIPAQRAAKGVRITQLDHKALEPMGVVKLDLLGIRGLTVLGDVADSLYSWRRSELKTPLQILDDIPLEDPETAARIEAGQTIGCFQIESPGMRATLKEVRARSIADLIVALALYRPGPLTGGLKDAFVRRHNRLEPVEHLHPTLAPLLADTYGVILYQEQVLRIAHELAGFSLAEADLLRRAMSHFNPGKVMETLRQKFIAGAQERRQVEPETGARIWELMAAFAGYGFPKAHAASYALIAWRSAWCKTHYPAEFMAAVLANWGGYYSQRVYLMEARRMGLRVLPPHVNHARREFSVSYQQEQPFLYMGLDQVRDLTHRTQDAILRLRPFHSLEDLLIRANPRKEEAANLVRCGALAGLGSIPELLARLETTRSRPGQPALFSDPPPANSAADWGDAQKTAAQQDILGVGLTAHPLELLAPQIAAAGAMSTVEAAARPGQRVRVAGIRQTSRRSRTVSGQWMLFLSLEDLEGTLDVVFFPDTYRASRAALAESGPIWIEGIMVAEEGRAEPTLRAEKASLLSPSEP